MTVQPATNEALPAFALPSGPPPLAPEASSETSAIRESMVDGTAMSRANARLDHLLNWLVAPSGSPIQRWRHRVLAAALLLITPALALPIGVAVWLGVRHQLYGVVMLDLVVYGIVVAMTLGRRLPYTARAGALVLMTLVVGMYFTLRNGPYSTGITLLVACPVAAALFFRRAIGWAALAACAICYASLTWLLAAGLLPWGANEATMLGRWLVIVLCALSISGLLMLGIWTLIEGLGQEAEARIEAEQARHRVAEGADQSPGVMLLLPIADGAPYLNGTARRLQLAAHEFRSHAAWESVVAGFRWHGEMAVSTENSRPTVLVGDLVPVRNAAGQVTDVLVSMADVSRQRALEARLRRDERLTAMGTLAGGMAHDLNNRLQPIISGTETAAASLPERHPVQAVLKEARAAALGARDMIDRLLSFVSDPAVADTEIDLGQLLIDSRRLLIASVPPGIAVEVSAEPGTRVCISAGALQQVLLQLCVNAAEAMPQGGQVRIHQQQQSWDALPAEALPARPVAQVAVITVTDQGAGIDPLIASRLFEPFFSTKSDGLGAGLGLTGARVAIAHMGGTLTIGPPPASGGACLRICLPIIEFSSVAGGETAPAPQVSSRRAILLVEDDALVRNATRRSLERLGWSVQTCADAREAIRMLGAETAAFDVVLTDYNMPRLTGLQLAKAARALHPGLPVVVMTGYLEFQTDDADAQTDVQGIIQKPFVLDELEMTLQRALSAERQPLPPGRIQPP